MSQNAKDDMPDRPAATPDRAQAGQNARRRVLGEHLRSYYASVASEPVPEALSELMAELARRAAAQPAPDSPARAGNTPDQPAEGGDSGQERE